MTNIPGGMLRDQYGIAGLLAFIKTAEADPSQVTLTLGTELTNLGLNLSSQEPLHPSFGGASFECPIRPQDTDYPVPQEYRINNRIR
jgi:CCR4-NOT transcription complex subunit 2